MQAESSLLEKLMAWSVSEEIATNLNCELQAWSKNPAEHDIIVDLLGQVHRNLSRRFKGTSTVVELSGYCLSVKKIAAIPMARLVRSELCDIACQLNLRNIKNEFTQSTSNDN